MNSQDPPVVANTLTCLHCGYLLRGLPGDPVCCPECGFHNSIHDRADNLKRRNDRIEAESRGLADLSLAALIVAAFSLLGTRAPWSAILAFCFFAVWIAVLLRVRALYKSRFGCLRRFLSYQGAVLLLILGGVISIPGAALTAVYVVSKIAILAHPAFNLLVAIVATIVVGAAYIRAAAKLERRLRRLFRYDEES